MIGDLIGTRTIASVFMPKKRKRRSMMPTMSAIGILTGAGIAYMSMRRRKAD